MKWVASTGAACEDEGPVSDSRPRDAAPGGQEDERWAEFWRSGALTSLPDAYAGNYAGAVREFWREQFSRLERGARVLDIGTGNGAIALLAARHGAEHRLGFEIHAIDRASIDPGTSLDGEAAKLARGVHFRGNVGVESLPFEDAGFDLITSQYALEYTRIEQSARELARVLAPGGRLALLLHRSDARPVIGAREAVSQVISIQDSGLLAAAGKLFERMAANRAAGRPAAALAEDREAEAAREAVNRAVAGLQRTAAGMRDPYLIEHSLSVLRQVHHDTRSGHSDAGKCPGGGAGLDRLHRDLAATRQRSEDLLACAHSAEARAEILQRLSNCGLEVVHERPLHESRESERVLLGQAVCLEWSRASAGQGG